MTSYRGAIALAMLWIAVTGSLTPVNAIFGLLLGVLCLLVPRRPASPSVARVRPGRVAILGAVFFWELLLSALRVARLVLSRRMDLKPGFFAYPLAVDRDFEITLLANLITLTPGTLSVDVSPDRATLYVHAIDCSDVDQTILDIQRTFERRILEAFR